MAAPTPQKADGAPEIERAHEHKNDVTLNDPNRTAEHGHNVSLQHNVEPNSDLALHYSREHQHQHLHHDARAEKGREDEVVYSKGTTFENSTVPDESPQDHELYRRHHAEKNGTQVDDAEKGNIGPIIEQEEDPKTHTFSTFYARFRIYFHLFIWLFFTGYVLFS